MSNQGQKELAQYEGVSRFLRKQGLKEKESKVGGNKIRIFRMEQLRKIIVEQMDRLRFLTMKHYDKELTEENVDDYLASLLSKGVISRYQRLPDSVKYKWPKTVRPAPAEVKPRGIYSLNVEEQGSMFWTVAIVVGILFFATFGAWPDSLRYVVWLVSLWFLIAIGGITGVRLVLYLAMKVAGYQFWIFPNLYADAGFLESFQPFLFCRKSDKNYLDYAFRVVCLGLLFYLGYELYHQEKLEEHVKDMYKDAHDWGVEKLNRTATFTQRALTVEEIINKTRIDNDTDTDI